MEILVTVLAILSLIFATFVIIEKIIFDRKIHSTDIGMTGRDVEDCTGLKLHVLKVDGATYYAHIYSKFKLFKYRFVFLNGKLLSKQRD